MSGCIDCKFHESNITGFDDDGKSIMSMKCLAGYSDKHNQWWLENGKKNRDEFSHMDCFQPTEGSRMLQEMIDLSKDILKELKSKNS